MASDFFQFLWQYFLNNKGKIIGGLIGFILAILILSIGIWKTLIIILFTLVGYIIGASREGKINIRRFLENILP